MATKLVKNLDNDTWRQFAGKCKMEGKHVGSLLTQILRDYLNNGR